MIAVRLARIGAVVLLGAVALQKYATAHQSVDVRNYQNRIRLAADRVPNRIGGWIGSDVAVPTQALSVLKPNVMISRRYVNVETGVVAGLMLVHCADAHHMVGHYPLRCYPARGWQVRSSRPRDWSVGDLTVTGTEYEFYQNALGDYGGERRIVVTNCLLRPNGKILRDMEGMSATIVGAGGSSSGAAQIQVYFESEASHSQQDAAFKELVGGLRPVVDAILASPSN